MTSYRQPGTVVTEHTFAVPLDHDAPDERQIDVFAREVVAVEMADQDLPWLLFLQGGPGFGGPRPLGRDMWLDRALRDYRVLLLDQRGTGRSTPANRQALARFDSAKAQADYLACFRADSIVRDCELIRRALIGDEPWSVLGQSFGGFCTVTYLSYAPDGMREAFITGGLPGLRITADDYYGTTYPLVAGRNAGHYERYPQDVDIVRRIARHLIDHDVRLPSGRPLTVEWFQSLGRLLGASNGSHTLHYLLEDAFSGGPKELSDSFCYQVDGLLTFSGGPLYALLHEACVAQSGQVTHWAAQRIRSEFPAFDARAAIDGDRPVFFTGEMIFPWMVDTDPVLRPLREAAELLAERDTWPDLYVPAKLAVNEVPAAAAVYYNDMYVPRELSMPTADTIRGLRPWVTSEYEHDGLRVSNGAVLDRLISMARGLI
jgi:pimeloyl-ACP methyl ester carboxylesterase